MSYHPPPKADQTVACRLHGGTCEQYKLYQSFKPSDILSNPPISKRFPTVPFQFDLLIPSIALCGEVHVYVKWAP
jgi:hypothetical protein